MKKIQKTNQTEKELIEIALQNAWDRYESIVESLSVKFMDVVSGTHCDYYMKRKNNQLDMIKADIELFQSSPEKITDEDSLLRYLDLSETQEERMYELRGSVGPVDFYTTVKKYV